MGVLEGTLLAAVAVAIAWAGYRTGWEARGSHEAELEVARDRRWFELSLILLNESEETLAKADREHGTAALARARSMSPEAVADLRAGRGPVVAELSDWLLVRERRAARLKPRLEEHPELLRLLGAAGAA